MASTSAAERRRGRRRGARRGSAAPGGPRPGVGIVHLGLGAFYRAHGAIYVAEAMARSGGDWGIVGVSLVSPTQRDRLAPQDFAYTALELGPGYEKPQVIDVVQDVLVAREDPAAVRRGDGGAGRADRHADGDGEGLLPRAVDRAAQRRASRHRPRPRQPGGAALGAGGAGRGAGARGGRRGPRRSRC